MGVLIIREHVIYNGVKYFIQSTGRYFVASHSRPRSLHRKVWTDNNGEIPKGYVIHHIDHNWRNNDISNLELLESRQHHRDHFKERPFYKIICKECGKEYSTKFPTRTLYCSKYCSQKRQHDKYITDERKCIECGVSFNAHRHRAVECCGRKCASVRKGRLLKQDNGNYDRKCPICEKVFLLKKELDTKTCSNSCAGVLRWRRAKLML